MRFVFLLALAMSASLPAVAADLRDGIVEQVVDLPIADADRQGVMAIVGMRTLLGNGDLIGEGSASDVAAVAKSFAGDEPAAFQGPFPAAGKRVSVRLTNGVIVVVLQPHKPYAFVGQSVRIEGSGRAALVVGQKNPAQ